MQIRPRLLPILILILFSMHPVNAPAHEDHNGEWWENEFVISTFAACRTGDDIERIVAYLADMNFTALESNTPLEYSAEDLTGDEHRRVLEACKKHGLLYFITDHNRLTAVDQPTTDMIKSLVDDYSTYPALGGYYVWDEPGSDDLPTVDRIYDLLQQYDPNHLPLNAMIPSYGPYQWPEVYPAFAQDFLEKVEPSVISFDFYGLGRDKTDPNAPITVAPTLYRDLELWTDLALERDAPLWFYPSSVEWAHIPKPTTGTLRFQAYAAIAYGAKGIQWFMARDFTGGSVDFINAPITSEGEPGESYQMIKFVNGELCRYKDLIPKTRRVRVAHTEPTPQHAEAFTEGFAGLASASEDLILALHHGTNTQQYLWVVNRRPEERNEVKLSFQPQINVSILPSYKPFAKGKPVTFTLLQGQGRLLALEENPSVTRESDTPRTTQ